MLVMVMLLTGCALLQPKIETRTEYITVPKSLLPHCPETYYDGETVGQALEFLPLLFERYEMCRSDVNKLIEYLQSRTTE